MLKNKFFLKDKYYLEEILTFDHILEKLQKLLITLIFERDKEIVINKRDKTITYI